MEVFSRGGTGWHFRKDFFFNLNASERLFLL